MNDVEAMFLRIGGGDLFVSAIVGETMKTIVSNGWAVKRPALWDTDYHEFEVTEAGRKAVCELQKRDIGKLA